MQLNQLSFNLLHPQTTDLVISGTSGIGKDAVIKGLKAHNPPIHFVITATTRPPRADEKMEWIISFIRGPDSSSALLKVNLSSMPWSYQDYKGIPRSQVEKALECGQDVVLKLDVQGAATIRKLYPQGHPYLPGAQNGRGMVRPPVRPPQ